MNFILSNIQIMAATIADLFSGLEGCTEYIGTELYDILRDVYIIIRIAVPVLTTLLITVDFAKAVMAQEQNDMEKAKSNAIKRLIIGLAIFIVPDLLDIVLKLVGIASGTCGIGG